MMDIRKLAHYIAGFMSSLFPAPLMIVSSMLFILYEVFEYVKKRDNLYLDVGEFAVGFYVGAVLRLILIATNLGVVVQVPF